MVHGSQGILLVAVLCEGRVFFEDEVQKSLHHLYLFAVLSHALRLSNKGKPHFEILLKPYPVLSNLSTQHLSKLMQE